MSEREDLQSERGEDARGGGGREPDDGRGDAAWVPVVQPGEAGGRLARTYEAVGAGERIDHIIGVHSLHPRAMEDHLRLYRTVMYGPSPLSRRQRESVAVVVSAANDCFY